MQCPDAAWQAAFHLSIAWNHHASWLWWPGCSSFKPFPFFSSCVEKLFFPTFRPLPGSVLFTSLELLTIQFSACSTSCCAAFVLCLTWDLPPISRSQPPISPHWKLPFSRTLSLINFLNLLPQIEKSSRPLKVLCIPCLVVGFSCQRMPGFVSDTQLSTLLALGKTN